MAKKAPVRKVVKKDDGRKTVNRRPPSATAGQADTKRQLKIQKALYEIADAASAVRDMQSFYKKLHRIVGKLMYAENFFIALYDEQTDLITWSYHADVKDTDDATWTPQPLSQSKSGTAYILRTGKSAWKARDFDRALKLGEVEVVGTMSVDSIGIPLMQGKKVLGAIVVQSYSDEHTYTEHDEKVLTFVAQHITTALTRLRALEAEHQRTDELAILNSVGEAMAKTLDVKTVTKIVGDKVRDIFQAESIAIALLDEKTDLIHIQYQYELSEGGHVDYIEPFPLGKGLTTKVIKTRQPLLLGTREEGSAHGGYRAPGSEKFSGEYAQSQMVVPIIVNDQAIGTAHVANRKRNYFSQNDLSLMQTLASNMGVAIQNARLFEAEQERVAELAIINSVQQGLASKLDVQAIYELIGDKIRDIFDAQVVDIGLYDRQENLIHFPYAIERGVRFPDEPIELIGFRKHVIETRQHLLINENLTEAVAQYGNPTVIQGEESKSDLFVPMIVGDEVKGVVSLQNLDRENAFTESDVRLLQTVVSAMSVALENARLFDETQRLLQETEQRNAELASINSLQAAFTSKLDLQDIYIAVGDKLRAIFDAHVVDIGLYDREANLIRFMYSIERGVRYPIESIPLIGYRKHVVETGQYLLINEDTSASDAKYGNPDVITGEPSKSILFVPMLVGTEVKGVISLQNLDREHAFSESDVRLLQTLVNSMSVALENARLFDETQRLFKAEQERVEELQIINSIQQGFTVELDFQAIIDLVGDKLRNVFDDADLSIRWYDKKTNLVHYLYEYEHGNRIAIASQTPPPGGLIEKIINTRQPVVWNTAEERNLRAPLTIPGTDQSISGAYIPIISSDQVLGTIGIENYERENAFGESEIRLLTTIAASLGTALENARLFKAEQERVAELQIINSIQQGLAAELDFQAIVDLVGDKLREVFNTNDLGIRWYEERTNLLHYLYEYEHGERLSIPAEPALGGLFELAMKTRRPAVWNTAEEGANVSYVIPGTDDSKSGVSIPVISSNRLLGNIVLENYEQENAFGESELRLLTTVAAALGSALENAHLFEETQRLFKAEQERVAELQIINSIQQGLASKLDFQAIIDLVGDKLREIFDTGDIGIVWYEPKANLLHSLYSYEHGKKLAKELPQTPGSYAWFRMSETRRSVVLNSVAEQQAMQIKVVEGTDQQKSMVRTPIIAGDQVIGFIDLFDHETENAYSESDVRLLETVANAMGVALENARLFDETQQRNAELAIINSIQQALAAELDSKGIYDSVGEKLREIFDAQTISIYTAHLKTRIMTIEYAFEKGQKYEPMEVPFNSLYEHIIGLEKIFVMNKDFAEFTKQFKDYKVPAGELAKSLMTVPVYRNKEAGIWVGVSIQDIDGIRTFAEPDVRLLETVAGAMSVALQNAQSFKAEQERVAELQIINSIQQGLAAELDFQAIVDLVGDKLREVFKTKDFGIRWYDEKANLVYFLYEYEHGTRLTVPSRPLEEVTSIRLLKENRQPVVANTAELSARTGGVPLPGTDMSKSIIIVPIISADRVIGSLQIENYERENAFGESELRLLTTIAASLGTALENARLFDETQRLLKETEERNAELAVINSVQAGLVARMDIQGIYDLVGGKIREIFARVENVLILTYDRHAQIFQVRYGMSEIRTYDIAKMEDKRFFQYFDVTKQSLVINENFTEASAKYGIYDLGDPAEMYELSRAGRLSTVEYGGSALFVPLIVGSEVKGFFSLQDSKREHAFSHSDVRLLETLANSMSVALESARLFDETQRLLKETEQRNAELALINGVQQGLASKLEIQAIIDLVGDKIRDVFDTQTTYIALNDKAAQTFHIPYYLHQGNRVQIEGNFQNDKGPTGHIIQTRETLLFNEDADKHTVELGATAVADDDNPKSWLGVPMIAGDEVVGVVSLQNIERENAYPQSDVNLLKTIASSLAVALQNAQLFDETTHLLKVTEDRAAELAIINSVQQGLASKLDFASIIDLVGDKVREIFNSNNMSIALYDRESNQIAMPYFYEGGKRFPIEKSFLGKGFTSHIIETRKPLMINEDEARIHRELGGGVIGDETMNLDLDEQSYLGVPILKGDQALGVIALYAHHKYAFTDSHLNLLVTMTSAMSVALENARLFDETQRLLKVTEDRAAELAIINSVQEGLASKLDMQAIYDLVGDKIQNMFNAQSLIICSFDHEKQTTTVPYAFEDGQRIFDDDIMPFSLLHRHLIETRQPVVINEHTIEESKRYGLVTIEGTQRPMSLVYVPFGTGTQVNGYFSLQNMEREHAFAESDVRLLQTLAGSMGIALENARLFNAEQQRVAELAVINSIQQGLAAELDFQTIIDLVGDKLREVLNTGEIGIRWYDAEADLIHYLYEYEHNERITIPSAPPRNKIWETLVLTRKPFILNSTADGLALGVTAVPGTDQSKSAVYIPIVGSDRVLGIIVTEDYEKENAYTEADIRLLSTVASSMGVALENARLFNETQQRNAELAIINSVQQGLASKLEFQSIIDLIGDKVTQIFNAQATLISLYNPEKAEIDHKYLIERGERIYFNKSVAIDRFRQRVVETRQPWLINQNYKQIAREMGEKPVLEGEEPKSLLFVPMIVGSGVTGVISLQNLDVENAFSESDVRLLSTIASSMSVALENARLFEAEQQRVAELAIINSIQQGLAAKLDMQAIYDLVGDKICEIFTLHTCYIMLYDREKGIEHYPYLVDNGKRVVQEDLTHDENGFGPLVMKTLQPIMINEDMEGRSKEVGSYNITEDGSEVKSAIYVPLLIGSEARGVISVQNTQKENAFTDSDLRLLTTLASSMSVALESARLFVETEQRAAELATINSIQEGLASKLEPQAIYDLVGEKLREVFGAQFLYIAIHNRETDLIHFPYFWERDHREITEEPIRYGEGLTSRVIETRQPIVINSDWLKRATELGGVFLDGELPKSSMSVPIMSGNTAIGVISLQSTVAENQYSESEVRLLSTIASSVGVALEGARLFEETEQRAAELAIINGVQEGLASKLEVHAIYELIGEKLRDLFGNMAISLVTFDLKKDIHHYEYIVEKGQRLTVEDSPITPTGRYLINTRQTLLVNDHIVENLGKIGVRMQIIPGTETPQSILRVPILIGDRVHGFIGLSDLDRENAFSPSDVRLLQTLAGSLSVALENARLFEETNRNAAELATVNTVSSALASELDIDPLIQLVGEQARAIFGADIVYVALLDEVSKTINFPYTFGEDLPPMNYGEGLTSKIIQTGKPLLINQDVDKQIQELGATTVGVITQSYLGVPIFVGARAVGVISVQSVSRQGAFDENAERLLTTIASNVGSALQNARLYREAQESRAAAEQANKAKSAFLANMSHELRTPLNAIIGFTRIVRRKAEGALPEKQTDNLDKVLTSAEHLLNLINTVLDIAKIEAGRMEVQASNFNISALADQCANTATPLLKSSVRLEKEIDSALTIIHSDQDKIKQIVLNLLSNAAKFTHEGKIVLRMRRVEPNLIVDVIDSGIGISEEALGRIFDEFQQADTSTTRQYGGTGLGLSISRNLARLLGGDLTATSDGLPGRGSTFTLTIPIQYGYRSASATKPEPESAPQAAHLLKADASKKLILVIDDDPDAVYLLQENLNAEEFEVVGTRNGLEGQQMARDLQPHAILLDIIMPDKDGWQVLHDLKADDFTKDIPVILLTIVDKKALGFQLGASAYLLKPLNPAAVQEALKRVTAHDGNGHVHVLVVDDDPHVADMLKQSLPESIFKLNSAEDGVAGLQAIEAHRPDVVLLDIMMPRLDGFGVIEQLRANEATRDLPVIVISAKELTDDEMKTLEERVNFVMKKQGFDGEKLMEEINSVLKK